MLFSQVNPPMRPCFLNQPSQSISPQREFPTSQLSVKNDRCFSFHFCSFPLQGESHQSAHFLSNPQVQADFFRGLTYFLVIILLPWFSLPARGISDSHQSGSTVEKRSFERGWTTGASCGLGVLRLCSPKIYHKLFSSPFFCGEFPGSKDSKSNS